MYVIAFQNTRDQIATTARCALQPAQLGELSFLEKGLDLIAMFLACLLSTIQFAGQACPEFLLSGESTGCFSDHVAIITARSCCYVAPPSLFNTSVFSKDMASKYATQPRYVSSLAEP